MKKLILGVLKEEVLAFPPMPSWDLARYAPGTSFKPNMITYQNMRQENADPMEHISWRPVEPVSTHQAHCSLQRNVIYEATQPLWEPSPTHCWGLPSWGKKLHNIYFLPLRGFVHTTHSPRAVMANISKIPGRGR